MSHRSGTLTSCALCLFVLCLIPYLLDVATCDEFNATPLHQPALVDGEEVDPSKATISPSSYDHQISIRLLLSRGEGNRKVVFIFVSPQATRKFTLSSLTSRPPPVS